MTMNYAHVHYCPYCSFVVRSIAQESGEVDLRMHVHDYHAKKPNMIAFSLSAQVSEDILTNTSRILMILADAAKSLSEIGVDFMLSQNTYDPEQENYGEAEVQGS